MPPAGGAPLPEPGVAPGEGSWRRAGQGGETLETATSWDEGVSGVGEDTEVEPTEPGSLNPWALSSGPSKKLRLNSDPASNETSAFNLSGGGALPRFALSDWSILNTSIVHP